MPSTAEDMMTALALFDILLVDDFDLNFKNERQKHKTTSIELLVVW
jgi:hypothetical protein